MRIRPMRDEDLDQVVALLEAALGPGPGGVDRRTLFEWKHFSNPFGRSMILVGEDEGRIAGVRAFMRWEFLAGSKQSVIRAVRAVDTATDPRRARTGVFSALTRTALELCDKEGVAFVFNTPNEKSRPGYLKMGWSDVAKWPIWIRARKPLRLMEAGLRRNLRTGASFEPPPASRLVTVATALDDPRIVALLGPQQDGKPDGFHTNRSLSYLQWRYTQGPVPYSVLSDPHGTAALVVRLRTRGDLREVVICEALSGPGADSAISSLLRDAAAEAGADHSVAHFGGSVPMGRVMRKAGFRRIPRSGLLFTARPVSEVRPDPVQASSWALSLGDLELF